MYPENPVSAVAPPIGFCNAVIARVHRVGHWNKMQAGCLNSLPVDLSAHFNGKKLSGCILDTLFHLLLRHQLGSAKP
jgi:hypothetical protein